MAEADGSLDLFDPLAKVPDGFIYRDNFLSADQERQLIRQIEKLDLTPFQYYQFTGKRRTVSFGWAYEFGKKDINPAPEIPTFLHSVRARAGALFDIEPSSLAHASIIEYSPGAPIGWHRDIPHFGLVTGISLGAACRMRFRKHEHARSNTSKRGEILSMELQPRSIYLMSGPSRESWQHSIPPVKELRYAIMLRTVKATGARQQATAGSEKM
jgi:alkylated DNA repair dioxygenase AlkB